MLHRLFYYVRNLWHGQETVGKRLVSSSAIIFLEKLVIKGIQFVRTVVVARILFPDDLGLFAMASLALGITNVFFTTGFASALIYEKDAEKYLDSAWTVNVIRGILLSILLFFVVAPLAGIFFKNPAAVPFARALAVVCFIGGFENVALVFFQKELQFIRLFLFDVASVVVQVIVTIVSVVLLRSAWALVFGVIAAHLTNLIVSYMVHPFRPRFTLDMAGARRLFKFGKWISVTAILGFFINQGDSAIVGRVLDASSLGFYQIAFALGMLPAAEFTRSFSSVLFPLYAKVRHDAEKLKDSFIRVSRVLFLISVPASFGILALAPDIVRMVYGEKWLPLVPALYVLVFLGLIRTVDYAVSPLLLGIGKPRVQTETLIAQTVVMYVGIVPLTKMFGTVGTALSVVIGAAVLVCIYIFRIRGTISIGFKTLVAIAALPFAASVIMASIIFAVHPLMTITHWTTLLSYVAGGALLYFGVLFLLDALLAKRTYYRSLVWIKENI